MNILNIPNFNILDVKETEDDYQILVESVSPPSMCVHCGLADLQRFGTKNQFFYDTPMHGKRVGIKVLNRAYRTLIISMEILSMKVLGKILSGYMKIYQKELYLRTPRL